MKLYKNLALILFTQLLQIHPGINFIGNSSKLLLSGSNASLVLNTPLTNVNGNIKITDKTASSITQSAPANTISFAEGGSLQSGTGISFLEGTLNPDGTDTIVLDGNKTLTTESGTILEAISVSSTGNLIQGAPIFSQAITLADAVTELDLGLLTPLNQDITLNGGKITLKADLTLKDGVNIVGTGTLDLDGHALKLAPGGSNAFSSDLTIENATELEIREDTVLNAKWELKGNASNQAVLKGNNNVLDLSGGGEIVIKDANTTATLSNIYIKGLGNNGGTITFDDPTCTLRLTNTTIELDGSYALTQGTVLVNGDNCKCIARGTDKFCIDDTLAQGSNLTVDGVLLLYDALDQTAVDPFKEVNGGLINKTNGGEIIAAFPPGSGGTSTVLTAVILTYNLDLTSGSSVTIDNPTPATPISKALDGEGNFVKFSNTTGPTFIIEQNVDYTIENTLFDNFDPDKFDLQGTGGDKATLNFGDGNIFYIEKDLKFNGEPINIVGDVLIAGNGSIIEVDSQKLKLNSNSTLTLKDVKLKINAADSIQVLNSNATVKLQKMDLFMTSNGMVFDTGNLEIDDVVTMTGTNESTPSGASQFSFTTPGDMTVKTGSELRIQKGTTFLYNPDTSGDGGDINVFKRHFSLEDPSSIMYWDHCTFNTGPVGFALDYGTVYVDGHTQVQVDTGLNAEFEIGSALRVDIMPAATLNINGPVKYKTTTYP